jgi:glucose/mannose transport system substrate-binding protein
MSQGRIALMVLVAVALIAALPLVSSSSATAQDQVEVFSWWTGPGEDEGLAAMVEEFRKANPDVDFVNATVSGGAGSNAKAILASRLLANDPPDSYQRHAGLELQDDVRSGKVVDLTSLYDAEGWRQVFPPGLLDNLTIDGKIYSVPVNIHRANLIWYNPQTLQALGIKAPPASWTEFLDQAASIRKQGKTPLALGPQWTQKHLLETVLLGELGADGYVGLWNGRTSWRGPEVARALETYMKVLAVSDVKSAAADWQPQLDRVMSGSAVYAVMGDWSYAYLALTKRLRWESQYAVAASPGSAGVFDFLSDAFTLSVGARHPDLARKWLVECGSRVGQDLFNPRKGSIPARTDPDVSLYHEYLAWDLQQWRDPKTRIVGSLTHGVVANNAWNSEIDTALGLLVQNGDVAKFAATVETKRRETS